MLKWRDVYSFSSVSYTHLDVYKRQSFDDLLSPIEHLPDTQSAQEDFQEFNAMLIDQYGRAVSQALREAAPHHLNLGMRYASGASEKTLSGAVTHFDVFSFNRYGRDPLEPAKRLGKATGMPIIVGEWHIGAADSEMCIRDSLQLLKWKPLNLAAS